MAEAGLVYTVRDRSLLLPFYRKHVVEPTLRLLSPGLDPNVITHFGHAINLVGVVILLASVGTTSIRVPFLLGLACLQAYNWCDNADGAHARRIGRCSAMGELLD